MRGAAAGLGQPCRALPPTLDELHATLSRTADKAVCTRTSLHRVRLRPFRYKTHLSIVKGLPSCLNRDPCFLYLTHVCQATWKVGQGTSFTTDAEATIGRLEIKRGCYDQMLPPMLLAHGARERECTWRRVTERQQTCRVLLDARPRAKHFPRTGPCS